MAKTIIIKIIDYITIAVLFLLLINFIGWIFMIYFPKYLQKNPPTTVVVKTFDDGSVLSQRFIQGTSIKHGLTKEWYKDGNLMGIVNYNYGVMQEQIYFMPREHNKK